MNDTCDSRADVSRSQAMYRVTAPGTYTPGLDVGVEWRRAFVYPFFKEFLLGDRGVCNFLAVMKNKASQ